MPQRDRARARGGSGDGISLQ